MTAGTKLLKRLRETKAVAAVEFALVLPVFLIASLGLLDIAYEQYAESVLQGVVHKAARDGTLEGYAKDQKDLDNYIERQIRGVWPGAAVKVEREAFYSFKHVGKNKPEGFTDANGNGQYDQGECFADANGNRQYDKNRGRSGNGGAGDVVLLTATVTMNRIFPGWQLIGQPQVAEVEATMVLKNQPYAAETGGPEMICGTGFKDDDGINDEDALDLWKMLKDTNGV